MRRSREGFATFRECPTSRSSSEGLANVAITTRYGLIASIAKVSHREVVVAKVSRRTRDTAPRSGQIGIVHNGGSRHEANVCELVRNGDSRLGVNVRQVVRDGGSRHVVNVRQLVRN